MARMYEMNLVIRLQDRASARMRRISGDMSALARHAQSQNKLMQLQAQAQRVQMKQGAALSTLRSMEVSDGEKRLANLAAQSSLTKQLLNQEIAMSTARTKRGTMGTIQVQRVIPKSVREDFIRLETDLERQQFLKRKGYNATEQAMMYDYHALRTRQLLLEGKITEEMAAQNRILAGTTAEEAALNAEIAQRSALTARGAAAEKNYVRGRTIAHGGSLAFMGGAVTTGLAGLAASSYAKFDVSSTKAATQVGAIGNSAAQTTKQAKELEKAILGMATEFPASADDMAQSAYDIFSSMSLGDTAVEQMTNGIKLLKVANKAAVGGQIDLGTATNTMITVLNDFNPSLKNIDHTMAQLFSTVRFMRGGFGDLGDAMNKLAPAAHASGQSLLEVGAAIAQVTRGIPSQAQAGTSVARLLDVFGRPDFQEGMRKFSAKFKQDLDITKVAADGTERLIPLHDIISKIVKLSPHLTGGGVDLQNTIKIITALGSASGKGGTQSTVQSRRALTELIIGYKNYSSILKQSREDTVEYDKSVKALSETAGVKWQIAMNKLKVAWIQFGQAAMPILLKVLDLLTRAFEHFSRMSSGHKKIIASLIVIAGLVATVGGLFASAFGGIFMLLAWNRLRLVLKATEALGVGAEVTATKIGLISKALLIMRRLAGPIAVVVSILYNISDKKKRHKIWDDAKHGMLGSAALELTVGTDFGIGDRFGGRKWKQPAKDREKWIKDALKDALSSKNTFGITNLNKVNKQAAAADKYGTDMLAWAKRMTAAEDASTKKIASYYKRLAKAKVEAAQAGKAAEEQSLKTMEAFMVSKESAFRSSNKQGMDLFGGPGAGGPIMGAFSDINNLLAGLNIKPIPVPVEFILQAQDFQVSQFEDWRSALDMLKKRLGPKYNKMVLELQSQGVASNPLVQSMLKATPAELKQWKTNWDKMQTDIEAATKADIKTLKDLWATYPKDVVTRIMLGLQDEEGTLSNGYRQYLVGTYPQQLAVEYGKAYNESLANWFASNPPPAPPKLPQMPKPKVGSASADRADMAKHPENYNDYPWVTDTPFGITEEMYKRMLKYLGYVTQINGSDFFGNPNLVRKNVVGPPAPVLKSPNMTPKGSQKGAPYRRAGGGIIPGTGSGDTVPAMLTPGEVVLNKRHIKNASQMLGTANHPQAVFNKVQHFAKGGVVAAKNYLGMKDVEFIKSSDGTISVMHVKGRDYLSRYRKYSPGQPGYDLLGTQGLHLTPEQLHPGKTKGLSLSGIGHGIAGLAGKAKRYGTGDLLHDVKSAAISSVKKQKHYGIGDTLRDVDAVIYGATGAHAKSIGKAYVPWVKQSAKQQAEIARVGEGAMFMGLPILGSGLASGMAQSGFMSYSMRASALSYHSATKVAARNAARRANAIHKGMPGSIGQNAFGITPHPHPVGKVVKTDAEEAARASHQANMLAWRREYNELQEKFGDYGTGLTEAEQAANKARRVELTAQMRSATAARPTAARAATSDIISPAQQKIINQREAEAATRLKETGQSTGVRLTKKQHLEKAAKVLEARRTAWRIKNDKIVVDNTEIRTVGLHDANTKLASLVEAATKTSATLGNLGYTSNLNELILHGSEALKGFGLKPKTLKSGSTTRSYREFAALAKAAERAPSTLRVNPDAGFRPGSESVAIDVLQSFLRDPKQSEFLTKEEAAALAGRAGHGTVFIKDIQKLIGAKGTIAKAEKRMAASRAAFPAKRVSTKKGTQTAATIAKQAEAEKLVKSGEVSINKSTRLRNAVTHNPQSKAFSRAERLFAALRSETGTLSLPTLATTVARSVLDKARKAKLMAQFKAGHIVRLTPHEAIALREMPGYVFHGTSEANAKSILKSGSILPQGKLNADPAYRAHLAGGSFWPGSIANSRDAGVVLAIPRKRLGDQLDATNIGRGSVEKYGPSQIATGVAAHYASRRGFDISPSLISRVKARTLEDRGSINKSTQNIGPIIEDSDFLKRIMDTATSLHLDGGGTEAEVAGLHEYVLKNYKKHYGSLASKISEALAGQSDVTLTPRGFNYLGSQDVFSAASWKRAERLREGDIDQLFSTLLDNNASDYGMFDVKFGKQSIYSQDRVDLPSMSVWAHDNKLHVDDVMDINDTEVFKTPLQKAMYVSALKSLRGEATEGRIKLYRGMSAKERASWGVGDTIPAGKYFTNIATSQYAQDIAGEFPELHSFLVDAVNIVETDPGSFQLLQDSTLSKLGIISAKSESINKSTRLPAHGLESEIGRVEAQKILDMLAANEPQVDIFRGLRNADFSNIDFDKLGVHWTTDRKIAELYAAPASVKNASGTVLSARTAIGNLIPPGPELEWWIRNAGVKTGMPTHHGSGMMQGRNIPWMDEFEATLRPGSKLNLTGSDLLTSGGKYSAVHDMDLTSAHQTLLGEGINKSTQSDKWKEAAPAVRSLWDRLDAAGGRKSRPKGSRGAEDAAAGFKRASSIWNVHPLLTNDPLTKSGLFAAFAHMDRIHRVPSDHNQLPMGLLQNTDQGATAGIAKHTTSSSRGSIPTGIDLAYPHMMRDFDLYSPNMYELALTAWHEMFHQYDYGFLKDQPKDKWPGSVFAAGAAGISSPYSFDRMRGKFNTSSAEDTLINPQLTEVFSQIYKTKLFDEQAQLGFLFHEPQVIGTYIKSGSDYRSIPYQVAPVELAARAYSQWMMTHPKSGVAMQRGFDKVHKAETDVGHWGRNQLTWDRDDFTGVAKSMEEFLGSKNLLRYAKGGWVPGTGNRDNYPAFLTPGEYVVSKPMIRDLTSRKASAAAPTTHVTHEQNINVDVTNPTGKAILDALKPVLFGLRHQP